MSVSQPTPVITRRRGKAQYFVEHLGKSISLDMVLIPEGTFVMGAPGSEEGSTDDERPQHEVSIETFFLGKYPVTQAQYEVVMDNNPSYFKDEKDSPNHPVEQVLWNDAVAFCHRLSEQTSKEYRLPSEAEWEYACRAGTTTPFHFGETLDTKVANYAASRTYGSRQKGEYQGKTTPVGSFKVANAFGLYDMHGNVLEWCMDNWHESYKGVPSDGRVWIEAGELSNPALRGGSWFHIQYYCRSACRHYDAFKAYNSVGFRVACSVRGLL
jgi:formylglycine-generating enzyme required for sulfatase activity